MKKVIWLIDFRMVGTVLLGGGFFVVVGNIIVILGVIDDGGVIVVIGVGDERVSVGVGNRLFICRRIFFWWGFGCLVIMCYLLIGVLRVCLNVFCFELDFKSWIILC